MNQEFPSGDKSVVFNFIFSISHLSIPFRFHFPNTQGIHGRVDIHAIAGIHGRVTKCHGSLVSLSIFM